MLKTGPVRRVPTGTALAQDVWQWSARHKGNREDAAAAEAVRAKEQQEAHTQLTKVQRQLLARLQRFLSGPEEAVTVLVADEDPSALEQMAVLLDAAADSNTPFGLPPLPLEIHMVSSVEEVCDCLSSHRIDIALVSIPLLEDFSEMEEGGTSTVFVAVHTRDTEAVQFGAPAASPPPPPPLTPPPSPPQSPLPSPHRTRDHAHRRSCSPRVCRGAGALRLLRRAGPAPLAPEPGGGPPHAAQVDASLRRQPRRHAAAHAAAHATAHVRTLGSLVGMHTAM